MAEKEFDLNSLKSTLKSKGNGVMSFLSKFFGDVSKWADRPSVYRIQLSGVDNSIYMQVLPALNPPDTDKASQRGDESNPTPDDIHADITIEYVNPETNEKTMIEKYENVMFDQRGVDDTITDYLSKHGDELGTKSYDKVYFIDNGTSSSKKLNVKLSKITSADSVSVDLVSVNCNYSPTEAMNDLNCALDSQEFISMIPDEGSASLSIVPYDDSLDIEVCQDCECESDTLTIFSTVMRYAINAKYNLMTIQYNVAGDGSDYVRDKCSSLSWSIDDMIANIASTCVQYLGYFPNPLSYISSDEIMIASESISSDSAKYSIRTYLLELVNAIELYYCDLPHEVQSMYDSWLLNLNTFITSLR